MELDEIPLGEDEDSRREVIRKYSGNDVILRDRHRNWCHGRIIDSSHDEFYEMRILDDRRKTELFYHDLQMLLTIVGHRILPNYSLER